jgi:pimeloyl-ACP methyl ester carboxylesterase
VIFIFKEIDDIKIYYDEYGRGKDIVLFHGWGASKNTFNSLAKSLEENYHVVSIDLPGFGETKIDNPIFLEDNVKLIHKLLVSLGIHSPILLGHSYGGRLAMIYSSLYKVDKLVLVSAAGLKEKLKLDKWFKIKIYKLFKKYSIILKTGSDDYKNSDDIKKKMLVEAVNNDLSNYLDNISTPTLLIYGRNDNVTSLPLARKINEKIKTSSLVVMEGSGHFPYLEEPTIFGLILNSFLAGDEC